MRKRAEEQLKGLPAKPGVYLFRGERGEVLYIGKAKSLRPRVRSYFQASGETRATIARLPERVVDVEVIVTDTEVEALHLEQNLVKRHRPPFNVRLRDDKSFPYIAVTVEDDYPRVMFTRERHRRGVVYFGPYANAKKVRETLDVLHRVFPYRPGAERAAADRRPPGRGRHRGAGGVPVGAARLAGRGARARPGREAAAPGPGDGERAPRARVGDAPGRAAAAAEGRGARGAARGAQPREPAAADRVLRRLEHPGRGGRRDDGRLPGRGPEEGALPQVRRPQPERPGRLRRSGGGDLAPVRAPARCRLGRPRRVVRGDPEPGRDRRREGAARSRAPGDAGLRPAAGGGDLAGEADRGGLRAGAAGADPARARLGRPPPPPARPGRGAPVRGRLSPAAAGRQGARVDLRHAAGGRPGAAAGAATPLRLGGALPRGHAGGARGRPRDAGQDGARDLCPAAQGRTGVVASPSPDERSRHGSRSRLDHGIPGRPGGAEIEDERRRRGGPPQGLRVRRRLVDRRQDRQRGDGHQHVGQPRGPAQDG